MEKTMCYVFGVLIVLLFSIEYYKRAKYNFKGLKKGDEFYAKSVDPLPAERLTNRPIYFFSYALFVVFSQAVFFSLTMTISFFVPLVGLKENLPQESLILASALLTIGFLPNMPFLQDMIRKTRTIFHRTKTSCMMNVGGYASAVRFRNISVGGVRVFTPEKLAIEKNQPVTLSFASDYQFAGRIASVRKKRLSITFNEYLGYDTINSIINYNQKRTVNFKYAA